MVPSTAAIADSVSPGCTTYPPLGPDVAAADRNRRPTTSPESLRLAPACRMPDRVKTVLGRELIDADAVGRRDRRQRVTGLHDVAAASPIEVGATPALRTTRPVPPARASGLRGDLQRGAGDQLRVGRQTVGGGELSDAQTVGGRDRVQRLSRHDGVGEVR